METSGHIMTYVEKKVPSVSGPPCGVPPNSYLLFRNVQKLFLAGLPLIFLIFGIIWPHGTPVRLWSYRPKKLLAAHILKFCQK